MLATTKYAKNCNKCQKEEDGIADIFPTLHLDSTCRYSKYKRRVKWVKEVCAQKSTKDTPFHIFTFQDCANNQNNASNLTTQYKSRFCAYI